MKKTEKQNTGKLKIIPLGGLEQIGMNITAFEYEDSIIAVSYTHLDVYKRQVQATIPRRSERLLRFQPV